MAKTAQIGSVQWYNEMAQKLRVVNYELRLERIRMNNKLPLLWDYSEIKSWIVRQRNAIKVRMSESLGGYEPILLSLDLSNPNSRIKKVEWPIWDTKTGERISGEQASEMLRQSALDGLNKSERWTNPLKLFFDPPKGEAFDAETKMIDDKAKLVVADGFYGVCQNFKPSSELTEQDLRDCCEREFHLKSTQGAQVNKPSIEEHVKNYREHYKPINERWEETRQKFMDGKDNIFVIKENPIQENVNEKVKELLKNNFKK